MQNTLCYMEKIFHKVVYQIYHQVSKVVRSNSVVESLIAILKTSYEKRKKISSPSELGRMKIINDESIKSYNLYFRKKKESESFLKKKNHQ